MDGINVYAVQWIDNKPVTLLSTFKAAEPLSEVTRYDKVKKSKTQVTTPAIVSSYNTHMGYVDEVNSYLGRYKVTCQSRSRYYLKIFHHFLNIMVTNSWSKYRRDAEICKEEQKDILSLYDFKASVSQSLLKVGTCKSQVGRKSAIEHEYLVKQKCGGRKTVLPPQDVRLDNVGHWPTATVKGPRCKNPNCDAKPVTKCEKCDVHLCIVAKDCFKVFHNVN